MHWRKEQILTEIQKKGPCTISDFKQAGFNGRTTSKGLADLQRASFVTKTKRGNMELWHLTERGVQAFLEDWDALAPAERATAMHPVNYEDLGIIPALINYGDHVKAERDSLQGANDEQVQRHLGRERQLSELRQVQELEIPRDVKAGFEEQYESAKKIYASIDGFKRAWVEMKHFLGWHHKNKLNSEQYLSTDSAGQEFR